MGWCGARARGPGHKTAACVIGTDMVDGVGTRIVAFMVDLDALAICNRRRVDDDARERQAEMRAQGHFMERRDYDFGVPVSIEPPE